MVVVLTGCACVACPPLCAAVPLVTFGFLVIPPLIVHPWAGRMRRFFIGSAILGAASSFIGFWIAYRFDLPVGPTDVALLGVLLGLSRLVRKLLRL